MSTGKLIRLTIQIDIEPENANLREAFEYVKRLKGAEQVELIDIGVVKDPRAEEKRQRQSLDPGLGSEQEESAVSPESPRVLAAVAPAEQEAPTEKAQELLDRIKIR